MGEDLSRERPKKGNKKMRLRGIEPPHAAPEATALSTELQTHYIHDTTICRMLQAKNEKSCYCTRVGIF